MNRSELDAFANRWLQYICEGKPLDALLAVDATPFNERAAAVRAKLGAPLTGSVDELVCEGDHIAWRWTVHGTHGSVRGVNFQRLDAGRVVGHWTLAV